MSRVILYFSFIFLSINCYASYEVDFLIGETKNTRPLSYAIKIKDIELNGAKFLNPQHVSLIDEDDIDEYRSPQIGDMIEPRQHFHFKISDNSKNSSEKASKIVYDVLNEKEEILGSSALSWYYDGEKINFVDSGELEFSFLPFQRQPSRIDKKGTYHNKYEISLIKD
jgi:hypothetical protein